MALQTPLFTYEDCKSRQQSAYNLRLTNWGNVGAGADPSNGSTAYNIRDCVIGVAIAATSDVDRCTIQYTPGVTASGSEGAPTYNLGLSVRSPVFFPVPGPIAIGAAATLSGSSTDTEDILYRWGDMFLQDQTAAPAEFNEFSYRPEPRLDLIIYLKAPVLAPAARTPKVFRFETVNGGGTLQAMRIPCAGRSRIDIAARPTGTLSAGTVTIKGVDASWAANGGNDAIERPGLGSATALNAADGDNANIVINNANTDFLTVYTTAGAGAGTWIFNVHMSD